MIEQIQAGGTAEGLSAITGKKNRHAGKGGLFATLIAMFATQHGHKTSKITNTSLRSIKAHHIKTIASTQSRFTQNQRINKHTGTFTEVSGKHDKQHGLLTTDGHKKLHIKQPKKNNLLATPITPMATVQATKTAINVTENPKGETRQGKPSGHLQQTHTGTATVSRKGSGTKHMVLSALSSREPEVASGNVSLPEKPVPGKAALERTAEHSTMQENMQTGEKHLPPSGRNSINVMNHQDPLQTDKTEATTAAAANKTLPKPTSPPPLARVFAKNPTDQTEKNAPKTLSQLNLASAQVVSAAAAGRDTDSNKTVEINLNAVAQGKLRTAPLQSAVGIHAHSVDDRSVLTPRQASTHGNQTQRTHTQQLNGLAGNLTHGLTLGDGQPGNATDQHGNQQGHQPESDSRFTGLFQSAQHISRSNPDSIPPVRSFQPFHVMDAMHEIAHSAKNGQTRLDIQLEPAHLGKIHISLQSDATKQLMVHITAEQPVSQQIIQQHIPQLRHALEQQGLSLGQFSMDSGSQNSFEAGQQFDNRNEWRSTGALTSSASPISDQANTHLMSNGHGRLSIHV